MFAIRCLSVRHNRGVRVRVCCAKEREKAVSNIWLCGATKHYAMYLLKQKCPSYTCLRTTTRFVPAPGPQSSVPEPTLPKMISKSNQDPTWPLILGSELLPGSAGKSSGPWWHDGQRKRINVKTKYINKRLWYMQIAMAEAPSMFLVLLKQTRWQRRTLRRLQNCLCYAQLAWHVVVGFE